MIACKALTRLTYLYGISNYAVITNFIFLFNMFSFSDFYINSLIYCFFITCP